MQAGALKAYLDHFLPREIIGPVIIVFSLEGVIEGIFTLYVPEELATLGWGAVFVAAVVIVAYWGTADDQAAEALRDRLDEIDEQQASNEETS
ncbi:MAG: hypothetical protein J07HX5_01559 [halophilic archaeon J07HX5]|jgi:hypothetical protein|nr:MAG: hypothetical protein J07HX5_01559 [halophilic archaeon J07HX5]